MIGNFSSFLVERLIKKEYISESNRELYTYAFFVIVSQLMLFVIVSLFGAILHCLPDSIVFYLSFLFLRKYAGGYHASTETKCELLSTLSMFGAVLLIRVSAYCHIQDYLMIAALILSVVILVLSPLDTPEKPLSEKERIYFRRITYVILLVNVAVGIVTYGVGLDCFYVPLSLCIILESVLLICGKIKQLATNRQ